MKNYTMSMAVPTVPVEHKKTLTIEEAAGLFGLGVGTIRRLISLNPTANYILRVGTHVKIKSAVFENFINSLDAI